MQIVVKGEVTPTVLVFYPIERETYDTNFYDISKQFSYLIDGMDSAQGDYIGFLSLKYGSPIGYLKKLLIPENPSLVIPAGSDVGFYHIKAIKDAALHKDFETKSKMLTPIVFSHGLASQRTHFCYQSIYYASYGCISYNLVHTDGSAAYAKDYNHNPPRDVLYDMYTPKTHSTPVDEFRMTTLNNRLKDIGACVNHLKENKWNIDMSKLTSMGHSMGGMTAIESGVMLPDFKLTVAQDPYYCARSKKIITTNEYKINVPYMILNTEGLKTCPIVHDHDIVKSNERFNECNKNNGHKNYNIEIKGTSHLSALDYSFLTPGTCDAFNQLGDASKVIENYEKMNSLILGNTLLI